MRTASWEHGLEGRRPEQRDSFLVQVKSSQAERMGPAEIPGSGHAHTLSINGKLSNLDWLIEFDILGKNIIVNMTQN